MVLLLEAVGALTLSKVGIVLGAYSGNNYDKNVKSAWERSGGLTDGFSIDKGKRKKAGQAQKGREKSREKDAKAIVREPETSREKHEESGA